MVMKRLSVVRYNVLVCNAEEFAKAVSEVENLIISTIEKVYAGCRKYRIIGNKPSLSRVVVKCNEGTFILRLRPFSYNCTGWLEKQLAIVGIDVRVKSYAYKFATFVKELAKAVESSPTLGLVEGNTAALPSAFIAPTLVSRARHQVGVHQ